MKNSQSLPKHYEFHIVISEILVIHSPSLLMNVLYVSFDVFISQRIVSCLH